MAELIAAESDTTVARTVETLRSGGLVVLPTDTVYGLAALPARPEAVDRIFAVKQRPPNLHLAVLIADADQLPLATGDRRPQVAALAAAFWPGPLTIVLPDAAEALGHLGAGDGTIGVRCPDHELVRQVARQLGPIAATSANRHGRPTPPTAAGVLEELDGIDLVIDGGPATDNVASTVVSVVGDRPRVLRPGAIGEDEVVAVWSQAER